MSSTRPNDMENAQPSMPGRSFGTSPRSSLDGDEESGVINPLELIRDRLEGRWVQVVVTSIITGAIAALLAWNLAPINYTAKGSLKGNSKNAVTVGEIEETGESRGFGTYLETQIVLLKSSDVVERSINSPEMKSLLDSRGRNMLISQIEGMLRATIYGGTELIIVQFSDGDASAATTITNSIMKSYIDLYGAESAERLNRTKQNIRGFKQENRAAAESNRQQQQALLRKSKYGIAEIGNFVTENANEMVALEEQKKLIREVLKKLTETAEKEGREITGEEIAEPKITELEAFDPNLKALKEDINRKKIEYDQLKSRLTAGHRQVRMVQSSIDSMEKNYELRKAESRQRWIEGPGKEQSYDKLQTRLAKLGVEITDKRAEIDEMNSMRDRYDELQRNIDDLDSEYAVLDDRLRGIEFEEDALEAQISISQLAVIPSAPDKDKRLPIVGVAFVGSVVVIFGLFFLLGSVDQRAFAMRQLQSDKSQFQCLGVVPDTGPSSDDPEALDIAMGCVHRLRNKIESMRGGASSNDRGFVMLISSPFQGDGKTTMATLLGWSYAESGHRTCLVDCDFIGRSLSHQFGKLHDPGLKEAVKSGSIENLTIPLGSKNLSILPIGTDEAFNAEHMPASAIRDLLDQLRGEFDMIIMDTGPLSGSIESTPIASSVDGVLLTLRKGRSRLPLRRCVQELRDLGAPYFGVVLNYADRSDYRHFSSTSKSIDDLLREESSGIRKRNPLTEKIARRKADGT